MSSGTMSLLQFKCFHKTKSCSVFDSQFPFLLALVTVMSKMLSVQESQVSAGGYLI